MFCLWIYSPLFSLPWLLSDYYPKQVDYAMTLSSGVTTGCVSWCGKPVGHPHDGLLCNNWGGEWVLPAGYLLSNTLLIPSFIITSHWLFKCSVSLICFEVGKVAQDSCIFVFSQWDIHPGKDCSLQFEDLDIAFKKVTTAKIHTCVPGNKSHWNLVGFTFEGTCVGLLIDSPILSLVQYR